MRALPAILLSAALVTSACTDDGSDATPPDPDGRTTTTRAVVPPRDANGGTTGGGGRFFRALAPFADCSEFLDHVKAAARERVGPYGLGGGPMYMIDDVMVGPTTAPAEMAADRSDGASTQAATVPSAGSDATFTGTNVQELGVDEPDIVKTDGDRILVVSENTLTYVDIASGTPTVTDRLVLPEGWGHELFFQGDRALLFTNAGSWGWPMPLDPMPVEPLVDEAVIGAATTGVAPIDEVFAPEPMGPVSVILEVDLSDPSALRVTSTMRVEGQYLSARAIGDHVRLAVSTGPQQLPWVYPHSPTGEDRATETNRAIVDESTLEDWIPSFQLTSGELSDSGPLLECGRMQHPAGFSGFDVISVLDLDLAAGLAAGFDTADAVGVLAGGQTVYSSTDRLYVATTKWAGADLATNDAAFAEWSEDVRDRSPRLRARRRASRPSTWPRERSPAACSTSSRSTSTRATCG